MLMPETGDEISVEVNAPPSIAIDVGEVVAVQPVTLSGGTNADAQNLFQEAQPQNVNFVMGPNGQLIAVLKPTFVWKHFWIGGGIPFALYFVPLLLAILASGYSDDRYQYEETLLTKEENSTIYSGDFTIDSDYRLEQCWINPIVEVGQEVPGEKYYCEVDGDDNARILKSAPGLREVVGEWNGQNGTIYFDAGTDHGGTEFEIQFEIQGEASFLMEVLYGAEEIMIFSCCFGFLLSLVMIIAGFSSGKPGMGWGGVAGLVAFPFIGIIAAGIA